MTDEIPIVNAGAPRGERPTKDEYFLGMADYVARRSNCSRRHFGAVIVAPDSTVLSTGYNGTPFGITNCMDGGCPRCADAVAGKVKPNEGYDRCICAHAEANAVLLLARNGGGGRGTTLYCQGSPCIYCFKEVIQAGVIEIVYYQPWRYEDPAIQSAYERLVKESGIRLRRADREQTRT